MSRKLTAAVPRLASTILLLAQNPHATTKSAYTAKGGLRENDIEVLMMKRHGAARFMPNVYVFPGGGVDVEDYLAAQDYLAKHYGVHPAPSADVDKPPQSFMEAKVNPSPEEGETEAWACRVGAMRELVEEAACVLQRDGLICTAAQWKARPTPSPTNASVESSAPLVRPPQANPFDVDASLLLRPVGRWVTPRDSKYRYDTYFYAALVRGAVDGATEENRTYPTAVSPAQSLNLIAQSGEVEDLLWLSPLEALRQHENTFKAFFLAPPTFLLLHALARQPSYNALAETWATTVPSPPISSTDATTVSTGTTRRVGTLPYSSVLPCVEPRIRMSKGKRHIESFFLPEYYFYERGWSEPAGAYSFCGEAFDDQTHKIRLWVGPQWRKKVWEGGAEVNCVVAQELRH